MNSSEATTENVGMGGNKDERQTTSKDETDESSSENQRNEQRQRQMDSEKEDSRFECNICLDMAKDAVVSMCGHLFCWPCLFQWMDTRPYRQLCPVCKSAISKDKGFPGMFHWGGDNGGHGGGGVQFSTPISLWPTNFVRHGSAMSILCLGKVADVYLIDEPSAYLDFEQRLHYHVHLLGGPRHRF